MVAEKLAGVHDCDWVSSFSLMLSSMLPLYSCIGNVYLRYNNTIGTNM